MHVIPQNSFEKLILQLCLFEKGERKLNIFLVLRIKRLSVYPETHSIVVGACVYSLWNGGMKGHLRQTAVVVEIFLLWLRGQAPRTTTIHTGH